MVSRLLREIRHRDGELAAANDRKERLRSELQQANERLAAAVLGRGDDRNRPGDADEGERSALRRRVTSLEAALATARDATRFPSADYSALREQNAALLKRNADLELALAELRAKGSVKGRLWGEGDPQASPPPAGGTATSYCRREEHPAQGAFGADGASREPGDVHSAEHDLGERTQEESRTDEHSCAMARAGSEVGGGRS